MNRSLLSILKHCKSFAEKKTKRSYRVLKHFSSLLKTLALKGLNEFLSKINSVHLAEHEAAIDKKTNLFKP